MPCLWRHRCPSGILPPSRAQTGGLARGLRMRTDLAAMVCNPGGCHPGMEPQSCGSRRRRPRQGFHHAPGNSSKAIAPTILHLKIKKSLPEFRPFRKTFFIPVDKDGKYWEDFSFGLKRLVAGYLIPCGRPGIAGIGIHPFEDDIAHVPSQAAGDES